MPNKKQENCDINIGGWHLRKEITVGQILTMVMIIVSGLWWAATVETRMGQLASEDMRIEQKMEITQKNMTDRFDRYQRTVTDAMVEIKNDINRGFDRIDAKLDKKQDKQK